MSEHIQMKLKDILKRELADDSGTYLFATGGLYTALGHKKPRIDKYRELSDIDKMVFIMSTILMGGVNVFIFQ